MTRNSICFTMNRKFLLKMLHNHYKLPDEPAFSTGGKLFFEYNFLWYKKYLDLKHIPKLF